eukprot:3203439-Amphidinium_carterae.1
MVLLTFSLTTHAWRSELSLWSGKATCRRCSPVQLIGLRGGTEALIQQFFLQFLRCFVMGCSQANLL